ncbi:hypothetical protein POM88_026699 [Heracleum sosnowskyi]|uniref:Uncharacterized protein n=1 Tax=Heracleum sosnowskyi TaxID=360622 RepID=A0AAD8I7A2_9APIA|nr:hypothetical protein POM88_026699 [Heracleum sosnowskyi]
MLFGWTTAGHLACPYCVYDHDAYNLSHGGKPTWFDNHRKFLPANHPFRKNKNWFTKGNTVSESAPPIRTGEDVFQEIESLGLMKITELGSDEHNAKIIKTYKCGWKKRRRSHGCVKTRYLDDREYTAANNYVLFNCPEVAPYIEIFTSGLREQNPYINGVDIDKFLESNFATWFKDYAEDASLVPNEFVRDLASGPLRSIISVPIYYVNGFKFHTRTYGATKSTFNSGEKIRALRAERSRPIDGSSTPQLVDENQFYYDAVGGRNNRNRIYGIGSSQDLFYAPSSSTIAHINNSSHPNSQDYEKLQTELEVMKERMKEMDAMQQRMKDMENLLARMSDNQNQ